MAGARCPIRCYRDLAELGLRVERLFGGTPQDIEWAVANGRLWLLQARPITNLPPAIAAVWESPEPGATWVRRQVVEHMPEPLSPLFAELYVRQGFEQSLKAIATIPAVTGSQDLFARLIGGPFLTTVNGYGYSRANYPLPREELPQTLLAIARWFRWFLSHGVDYWQEEGLPAYLATIAHWQAVDPATAADAELLRGVRELAVADAVYWFPAAIAIGLAKISDSTARYLLAPAGAGVESPECALPARFPVKDAGGRGRAGCDRPPRAGVGGIARGRDCHSCRAPARCAPGHASRAAAS